MNRTFVKTISGEEVLTGTQFVFTTSSQDNVRIGKILLHFTTSASRDIYIYIYDRKTDQEYLWISRANNNLTNLVITDFPVFDKFDELRLRINGVSGTLKYKITQEVI